MDFSINTNKSFHLISFLFQILENYGCYRLPPLKGIWSLRFREARKKDGFGIPRFRVLGGYHP
jgi:hypothetical protein